MATKGRLACGRGRISKYTIRAGNKRQAKKNKKHATKHILKTPIYIEGDQTKLYIYIYIYIYIYLDICLYTFLAYLLSGVSCRSFS